MTGAQRDARACGSIAVVPEIELKLQVPAAGRPALERAVCRGRVQRIHLRALYFDTPERALAAAGLALRLRREGRRWVQTLKGAGDGPIARLEHEVVLGASRDAPPLDPGCHAGTPEGEALAAALGDDAARLAVCFETDVWRTRRELREGGARIELALDIGTIRAGASVLSLAEVEFELLHGGVDALVAVAGRWASRHGLWLDTRSKALRGHLLAMGAAAEPAVKSIAPPLKAHDDPDAALRCMVRSALSQILPNASALAAGTAAPEHLHQARIGLRRLLAALREFGAWSDAVDGQWAIDARQMFGELGRARDRDAIAATLWPSLREAGAPRWQLDAAPAATDAGAAFRAPAATQCLLGLIGFACTTATAPNDARPPLKDLAQARLRRLHRQVHGAGKDFVLQDSASRHRARKRLKRLRYCAEFTSALWPARAWTAYSERLRRAQDALGVMQDNATAEPLYRAEAEHDPRAWFVVGWLVARREVLVAEAGGALRNLGKTPKFLR
jgi:triphosphatase